MISHWGVYKMLRRRDCTSGPPGSVASNCCRRGRPAFWPTHPRTGAGPAQLSAGERRSPGRVGRHRLATPSSPGGQRGAGDRHPDSERAFASTHGWTGEWHWLSGTQAQLAAVWKTYGTAVLPGPTGNIPHSIAPLPGRPPGLRAGRNALRRPTADRAGRPPLPEPKRVPPG